MWVRHPQWGAFRIDTKPGVKIPSFTILNIQINSHLVYNKTLFLCARRTISVDSLL